MSGDRGSELDRVRQAAAALSPLERDVLVLSAGIRLSNGEIAARLGISERRAERLLARALRKFDRVLEQASRGARWRVLLSRR
jgi:RNA polymerase sigma factor (sigma-70 family)